MSKVSEFAKFLDKDLGITLNKTGMDRNLGESDITTGDTKEERKTDAKKKAVTQLVSGLADKQAEDQDV